MSPYQVTCTGRPHCSNHTTTTHHWHGKQRCPQPWGTFRGQCRLAPCGLPWFPMWWRKTTKESDLCDWCFWKANGDCRKLEGRFSDMAEGLGIEGGGKSGLDEWLVSSHEKELGVFSFRNESRWIVELNKMEVVLVIAAITYHASAAWTRGRRRAFSKAACQFPCGDRKVTCWNFRWNYQVVLP